MSRAFVVVLAGILGLLFGSFGTVVAWRVPRKESIVSPGSHCPACNAPIRAYDNIPVVSWLWLRGRCRSCRERVSIRYPLVELGVGLLFAASAWRASSGWLIPAYCAAALALVILTEVDLELRRLPTAIVYTAVVGCGGLLALAAGELGDWHALLTAGISGVALTGVFWVIHFVAPKGMGRGDVRMAGLCGMLLGFLGWRVVLVGFMACVISAGLVGVALIATGRANAKTQVPFGPYLALGTMVGLLFGGALVRVWLGA